MFDGSIKSIYKLVINVFIVAALYFKCRQRDEFRILNSINTYTVRIILLINLSFQYLV